MVVTGTVDVALSYCHYCLNDTLLEDHLAYLQDKQVRVCMLPNAAPPYHTCFTWPCNSSCVSASCGRFTLLQATREELPHASINPVLQANQQQEQHSCRRLLVSSCAGAPLNCFKVCLMRCCAALSGWHHLSQSLVDGPADTSRAASLAPGPT